MLFPESFVTFRADRRRFESILTLPAGEVLSSFRNIQNVVSIWNELKLWVIVQIKLFNSEWTIHGWRRLWKFLVLRKLKAGERKKSIASVSIQGRRAMVDVLSNSSEQ